MPVVLKAVTEEDRRKNKNLPPAKEHEAKFGRGRTTGAAADLRREIKEWQGKQRRVEPKKNPDVKIKARTPSANNVARLAAVANSDSAPEEIIRQKFDEEDFFGTLFSSLTTYEYLRLEGEYRKRKASVRTAKNADAEWANVVQAFRDAFANAGLKVSDGQLAQYAKELASNKRNLETVARIANSAVADKTRLTEDPGTLLAGFVAATAMFIDPNVVTNLIPNLCSTPFAQGSFTKFWGKSWSLTASIPYPCPTWSNPFRICWKTVTIATVSVNVGLNVGYKVSCCGASAWGQASAQACASVAGIQKCVGCTATVIGVAGFSRYPSGSQCIYGLGINASVQCSVFGYTVFNAGWSFGYTINGPCPPPGLCP